MQKDERAGQRLAPRASSGPGRRLVYFAIAAAMVFGTAFASAGPAQAAMSTRQIQMNLATLAYLTYEEVDGIYGDRTRGAVVAFQASLCLDQDGDAGPKTQRKLVAVVKKVQRRVKAGVDGLGGPETTAKIVAYQSARGLDPDGRAGPVTMQAMRITRNLACGQPTPPPATPGIIGDPLSDSSNVACAAGTSDLGVHTAWYSGRSYRARLCAITGFRSSGQASQPGSRYYIQGANGYVVVNSRVSGTVRAMFLAAQRDGLTMSATSSYRSYDEQNALCPCDGVTKARPGYSPHQSGVAIDFAMDGRSNSGGHTCSTRSTSPSSATWQWLVKNGSRFGYRQYAHESWHWDTLNTSNRC